MIKNQNKNVAAILLAGGVGSRMGMTVPKQFLFLHSKPIVQYSYEVLCSLECLAEIVIVCEPHFYHFFQPLNSSIKITFASPGSRRQDSVYNGLQAVTSSSTFICVHDSARPCISKENVEKVINEGIQHGAATLGVPVKFTIKECSSEKLVTHTPKRENFWEIQTPQVIKKELLELGFDFANRNHLTVTDDVSLVELLKHPVKLVEGSYNNLKVTTPIDLELLRLLMEGS